MEKETKKKIDKLMVTRKRDWGYLKEVITNHSECKDNLPDHMASAAAAGLASVIIEAGNTVAALERRSIDSYIKDDKEYSSSFWNEMLEADKKSLKKTMTGPALLNEKIKYSMEDFSAMRNLASMGQNYSIPIYAISTSAKLEEYEMETIDAVQDNTAKKIGEQIGILEEKYFVNGDGFDKPLGFLHTADVAVTTESDTVISTSEVQSLIDSLDERYRETASFICSESTLENLMQLRDKNGEFIWKPADDSWNPDTLFGYPIYISCGMPDASIGSKALAFGDFSEYVISDNYNWEFKRSFSQEFFDLKTKSIFFTAKIGGKLMDKNAIKILQMDNTNPAEFDGDRIVEDY